VAKRVFLLHDVHAGAPITFMSRWALSYLRGPLSKEQIRTLHLSGSAVGPQRRRESRRSAASVGGCEADGRRAQAGSSGAPVLPPRHSAVLRPRAAWRPVSSCRARRRARDVSRIRS
jgi:hypothetical protein